MADMGPDFRAPSRDDRAAWRILEALCTHEFTFHNCGCGGVGFTPPRSLRELPGWLETHRRRSPGEALARRFSARPSP
jgi:hypothetical protein